jgi:peptide/nickel transport system substrate-binding protein
MGRWIRDRRIAGLAVVLALAVTVVPSSWAQSQLVIGQSVDAVTLDPQMSTQLQVMNLFWNIYDCLTVFDDQMELKPQLATSWRNVNPTTWQFKLRQGVKYHNGEPFDGESVKFHVERVSQPGKTSVTAGFATIERVEVVDPHTVNVVTKKPDPLLPRRFAAYGCQMIPPKYTQSVGFPQLALKPVGTGPYKFVEWVKDSHIVLEANKEYWGGAPAIQKVIWKPIPDNFARVAALQKGEVDLITNVPVDLVAQIQNGRTARVEWTVTNLIMALCMGRGGPSEPIQDRRVRLAMNLAIDREAIIKKLMQGYGLAVGSGIPTTDFGYDPNVKPYPYDPERAKKLLAEAGYPNGFTTSFKFAPGYIIMDKPILEVAAGMLAKVGVNARVETIEMAVRTKMLVDRKIQGWLLADPASTLNDADGIVWRLLHPSGILGGYWEPALEGGEFYKLMEEARYTLDEKRRLELYHRAGQMMHDDPPWIYLMQEPAIYGVSNKWSFKPRAETRLNVTSVKPRSP